MVIEIFLITHFIAGLISACLVWKLQGPPPDDCPVRAFGMVVLIGYVALFMVLVKLVVEGHLKEIFLQVTSPIRKFALYYFTLKWLKD